MMLIGNVLIYAIGLPWLMAVTGYSLQEGIAKGVTPFLVGDAIKLVLAAGVFRGAWWLLGRRSTN
jgi:biotin transport system substrate-specific component